VRRGAAALAASNGSLAVGVALAAVTVPAWVAVLTQGSSMAMPGVSPSLPDGVAFTGRWGVMMAAMMLPSAAPMILLYRTVTGKLSAERETAIPVALFGAVYLAIWLIVGIPVYGAYVATAFLSGRSAAFAAATPYAVSVVVFAAGVYQLTGAKRACLRHCESPLEFLMKRWRSGRAATLHLAVEHAGYCLGCCWGLMAILVVAGAMSTPWVLAVTLAVFAEKVMPQGQRTARVIGIGLILLAIAIAAYPPLAATRPGAMRM
jgi:predicted metal-binding membrane protein